MIRKILPALTLLPILGLAACNTSDPLPTREPQRFLAANTDLGRCLIRQSCANVVTPDLWGVNPHLRAGEVSR